MLSKVFFFFCRGLISENGEIRSKCEILEPLSFALTIMRSLSFAWYKSKPEVSVDAHISALQVRFLLSF